MTTYINREEINVNEISVATFNADAFAVEGENVQDVIATLDASYEVIRITPEEDEFCDWAERLDFGELMPRAIYLVDGNTLAFVLTSDNPYYD